MAVMESFFVKYHNGDCGIVRFDQRSNKYIDYFKLNTINSVHFLEKTKEIRPFGNMELVAGTNSYELRCIIDARFNVMEYEKIIIKFPGTRNKYMDETARRFFYYFKSAIARGLKFELTLSDYVEISSTPCVLCGDAGASSIDRISSSKHYTKDNVQNTCGLCNMMKFKFSNEVFIRHIRKVADHQKVKPILV